VSRCTWTLTAFLGEPDNSDWPWIIIRREEVTEPAAHKTEMYVHITYTGRVGCGPSKTPGTARKLKPPASITVDYTGDPFHAAECQFSTSIK
jgi:hypothetical protein